VGKKLKMANIILFDNEVRMRLLPLTYTRPVCEIRIGITTIREKWEREFQCPVSFITEPYLSTKFPMQVSEDNLIINGSVLPGESLNSLIRNLQFGEALMQGEELIATRMNGTQIQNLLNGDEINTIEGKDISDLTYLKINFLWDIFSLNEKAFPQDFVALTAHKKSLPIPEGVIKYGHQEVFIEEGAVIEPCILHAVKGPLYFGKNTLVMAGSVIRGSFALCENSVVKAGAKIYEATTIGPFSKVGGEIKNSLFFGHSNKAHDGYLGDSVIGEWCNLGAGTNNSNMKNDYTEVKLWNYELGSFVKTGLQFCGMIMGDHTKTAIGTQINTGTVIGVGVNLYEPGFPPNFIPSFSKGGKRKLETQPLDSALKTANLVLQRRGISLDEVDQAILASIFEESSKYRRWEK
jgi:UDP-N-acetylglucosamine diphosphorylase/glucosamine-1-phosphate N-acetyltransferase